jgi:hypothetical protein
VHLYFSEDNCLIRLNAKIVLFLGIYGVWSIKYEKINTYGATMCKIAASTDKNCGNVCFE